MWGETTTRTSRGDHYQNQQVQFSHHQLKSFYVLLSCESVCRNHQRSEEPSSTGAAGEPEERRRAQNIRGADAQDQEPDGPAGPAHVRR